MAARVLNRIPRTLPVFNNERLVIDIPTFSESSVRDIFRLTIIKSRLTFIPITVLYLNNGMSVLIICTYNLTYCFMFYKDIFMFCINIFIFIIIFGITFRGTKSPLIEIIFLHLRLSFTF